MEEFSKDELFYVGICENRSVINTIIQAIKQLDREIKENKNMNRKFKYVDRIISNGVETLTPKFELPKRSTSNSAGYDFICPERVEIPPYKLGDNPILIKTGVKAYMQNDEVLMLYNRSSNPKKKKLVIPNSVGVIDADYYGNEDNDGEIGFTFYNLSNETVIIEAGEKLGQGILQKELEEEVSVLLENKRSDTNDNKLYIQYSGKYNEEIRRYRLYKSRQEKI